MALSIEQKSVYLSVLNSTMILRSIGRSLRSKSRVKEFKIRIFKETEILINKIENSILSENDILDSIDKFCDEFSISFGQAQKAINVVLKYHYYMYEDYLDAEIKSVLHCPLDSKILNKLGINNKPLTKIGKKEYLDIQNRIYLREPTKIDFDKIYDIEYLKDKGIL